MLFIDLGIVLFVCRTGGCLLRFLFQGDLVQEPSNKSLLLSQIAALLAPIKSEVDSIKASQPNTVPVQWPNLIAVNSTPYAGGFWGNNYGWGNGFNGYWS